ncbi:ybiT, partial [Symbiodinium pilosum]
MCNWGLAVLLPDAAACCQEFVVSAGQRLALLGPNGCGKTTLLRSLAGRLEVEAGSRILGVGGLRRARVAFFTQDLAQDLPGDITPVEHVLGDDARRTRSERSLSQCTHQDPEWRREGAGRPCRLCHAACRCALAGRAHQPLGWRSRRLTVCRASRTWRC